LTVSHVRHRARLGQGFRNRLATLVQAAPEEVGIDDRRQISLGLHDPLRFQAGERRVVLMHALHGDPLRRRPRGLGQRRPPCDVGLVQQAGPINRAQHDGLPRAEQHDPHGFERIVHHFDGFDPPAAARMPDRRGDIELKRRDVQASSPHFGGVDSSA
jgi:hypothetical protein